MDLLVKSANEFFSVTQRARADLSQLQSKLKEMFDTEFAKIDHKYQPKYFNYSLNKPTTLLKPQLSNPFFPSGALAKPSLKRSRSAFGVEDPPTAPFYSAVGNFRQDESGLALLHTDASPPCVRPRISANLTPQSPKVERPKLQPQGAALTQPPGALPLPPPTHASPAALKAQVQPQLQPQPQVQPQPQPQFQPAYTPASTRTGRACKFELPQLATEPLADDQYSITSYSETDAEHKAEQEDRRRRKRGKKRIPTWCKDWQYLAKQQQNIDPDAVFFTLHAFPKCDLGKIFGDSVKFSAESGDGRSHKRHRGSSGNWGVDGLTDLEIINYKKLMGQVTLDLTTLPLSK